LNGLEAIITAFTTGSGAVGKVIGTTIANGTRAIGPARQANLGANTVVASGVFNTRESCAVLPARTAIGDVSLEKRLATVVRRTVAIGETSSALNSANAIRATSQRLINTRQVDAAITALSAVGTVSQRVGLATWNGVIAVLEVAGALLIALPAHAFSTKNIDTSGTIVPAYATGLGVSEEGLATRSRGRAVLVTTKASTSSITYLVFASHLAAIDIVALGAVERDIATTASVNVVEVTLTTIRWVTVAIFEARCAISVTALVDTTIEEAAQTFDVLVLRSCTRGLAATASSRGGQQNFATSASLAVAITIGSLAREVANLTSRCASNGLGSVDVSRNNTAIVGATKHGVSERVGASRARLGGSNGALVESGSSRINELRRTR
jgi:hypothetical protein